MPHFLELLLCQLSDFHGSLWHLYGCHTFMVVIPSNKHRALLYQYPICQSPGGGNWIVLVLGGEAYTLLLFHITAGSCETKREAWSNIMPHTTLDTSNKPWPYSQYGKTLFPCNSIGGDILMWLFVCEWVCASVCAPISPSLMLCLEGTIGLLSRLQLASANRVAALTSHDGILWVQSIPNVKNR